MEKGKRQMIVAVCIDDKNGMMFNKRRQSQDRLQRHHLRELADGRAIWMNAYSAVLFQRDCENPDGGETEKQGSAADANICVAEDFLAQAGEGEFCFVENQNVSEYEEKIESVLLYKWNRVYPSDRFFDLNLSDGDWEMTKMEEFAGSSHEKITVEYYQKKKKTKEEDGE